MPTGNTSHSVRPVSFKPSSLPMTVVRHTKVSIQVSNLFFHIGSACSTKFPHVYIHAIQRKDLYFSTLTVFPLKNGICNTKYHCFLMYTCHSKERFILPHSYSSMAICNTKYQGVLSYTGHRQPGLILKSSIQVYDHFL